MDIERVWVGDLTAGRDEEHEAFVAWLAGPEAERMFRQYRLTGYELGQQGLALAVTMSTSDPAAIIRFLRNHGAWPEYWIFRSNRPGDQPPNAEIRVSWHTHE